MEEMEEEREAELISVGGDDFHRISLLSFMSCD